MAARRVVGQPKPWLTCGVAGLLTALLTLLILGALLVEQPTVDGAPLPGSQGLRPNAPALMAGFVGLGVAIGLLGCAIASTVLRSTPPGHIDEKEIWLARLAGVAVLAVVPLLIVGGKVTSAKAGMAIIGWPGSDGANMFLYPIALMANPERFLEHTHRLFGTLVGLTFLALMLYTFAATRSSVVRLYAIVLFVGVVVQGVLGGVRVTNNSVSLAAGHGVLAQLFFAGAVAFAARVRPLFDRGLALPDSPRTSLKPMAIVLFGCLFVQLVFGAIYRHMGHLHSLWSHVGFSFIVLVLCIIVGAKVKRAGQIADSQTRAAEGRRTLTRVGSGLSHVVGLQFVLGWIALWAVLSVKDRSIPIGAEVLEAESVPVVTLLIRTAHQANGALLLAYASLALVWTLWMYRTAIAERSTALTGHAN
ncbi:MAG: COX15/CtaA family protein [Phycisphaeraceae bacterium]|nr:COX15/CtaA family protein [Phycisphaeraceae bacterium]